MTYVKIISSSVVRQYLAGGLCSISMAIVGILVGWTSLAIPKFINNETRVHPTTSELSWIVSSLHVGNVFSALAGSYLMDRFGRKTTLVSAAICPTVSWIIKYYATSPYHIYFARFLCGLSLGCNYMITPVYLSEIAEPKVRGSIGNLMAVMLNFGVLYEYSIGPHVSYNTLLFLSMLIPLTYIITFAWMPESPYYYVMRNQNDKALKSLTWLRYDRKEDDIINELNTIDSSTKEQIKSKGTYKDLISIRVNRKALIMVLGVTMFQRTSGMGPLMNYATITLPKDSVSWLSINQCLLTLSIFWFAANFTSTFIIDHFNRKTLLTVSSLGCGMSTFVIGMWFYLKEKTRLDVVGSSSWVPFVSFLVLAEFYAIGLGSIGGSIRGELFPANVKSKSSGITQIFAALVSFVLAEVYLILDDYYGMFMNYFIYAGCCLISIVFVVFCLIETRGKSLQKIQDELKGIQ